MNRPLAPGALRRSPTVPGARRACEPREWIGATAAARLLGVARGSVPKIAAAGAIRTRKLPGHPMRYLSADVLEVLAAAESGGRSTRRPDEGGAAGATG